MQRLPTPAPSFLETIYRIPKGIINIYLQTKDADSLALLKFHYVEVTQHEESFSGFLDIINALPLDSIEMIYSKTLTDTAKINSIRQTIARIQSFMDSVLFLGPNKVMPRLEGPPNFVTVVYDTGIIFDAERHSLSRKELIRADKLRERQQQSEMVEVVAGSSTFYNKNRHHSMKTEIISYRVLNNRRLFKQKYEVLKGTLVEYEDKFGDKETEFVSREVMHPKKVESVAKKAKRNRDITEQEPNFFRPAPRHPNSTEGKVDLLIHVLNHGRLG